VAAYPALQFVPEESQTIGGFGRNDRFSYHRLRGGLGEVANRGFELDCACVPRARQSRFQTGLPSG
jgi:hypothetical protein